MDSEQLAALEAEVTSAYLNNTRVRAVADAVPALVQEVRRQAGELADMRAELNERDAALRASQARETVLAAERDHWHQQYDQLLTLPESDRREFLRYQEFRQARAEVVRLQALLTEALTLDSPAAGHAAPGDPDACQWCDTRSVWNGRREYPHTADCLVTRALLVVGEPRAGEDTGKDFHKGIAELRALNPYAGVDVAAFMRDMRGDEDDSESPQRKR